MNKADNTIEHARFGLKNTQNTIAFIDKKVAAGVSIVAVILGFVYPRAVVSRTVLDVCSRVSAVDWYVVCCLFLVLLSCLSVTLALYHAYKTIFPRTPNRGGKWVLFPFSIRESEDEKLYNELDAKLSNDGMSDTQILEEFRDQLSILGVIQARKMVHCKATFQWLGSFVAVLGLLAVISLFN